MGTDNWRWFFVRLCQYYLKNCEVYFENKKKAQKGKIKFDLKKKIVA